MHKYRLYRSERRRLHHALHGLSLGEGNVLWDDRVPSFYERAKELADQTWAAKSEWKAGDIVLDDYDVFVFHQACLRPADPLDEAAEWAREVFDPPQQNMEFYGVGWKSARQAALERANHICESCGTTQQQHRDNYEVGLHVHHQKPVRTFEHAPEAHTLSNLEVLCVDCHSERHSNG